MDQFRQDLRFGFRMLFKNPGMTVISVIALSLGIGLTTTMFSIVYGALFRGLPVPNASRLMHLERNNLSQGVNGMEVTVHDFTDWREQQKSFEDLAAFYQGTVNISGAEGRPERFAGAFMTANAFDVIGIHALLGRTFQPGDDEPGAAPVVILGYGLWANRFESRRDAVGEIIRVNGEPATIIGVMPEGFMFPLRQRIWVPMKQDPSRIPRGGGTTLEVFGRLRPGVSADRASAEFETIAKRLADTYPATNAGVGVVIKPYTKEFIGDEPTALLYTMLGAVFFVLLIACANVANLLLSRAAVRSKEVAIRSALGANRWRVIVQLLTETFSIALVGGLIGLGIGVVGVKLFNAAIADTDPPYWIDIRIDPVGVAFVLGLVLIATMLAGLFPAFKASGARAHEVLKDETRGTSSMRIGRVTKGLVVAEVALSCGLLVAAGLMIKSVAQLRLLDYGFDTNQIFSARLGLFQTQYPDTVSRQQFFDRLLARLGTLPNAESAALTTALPVIGGGGTRIALEGKVYAEEHDYPSARFSVVTPDFFTTFGVAPLQGRVFESDDDAQNIPVAVVNQSFVDKYFPNESPLGRRLRAIQPDSAEQWRTIVGVVPDLWMSGVQNENPDGFYVPLAQSDAQFISIAVRARGDARALAPQVRDQVLAIDQDLPLYWVRTLQQGVNEQTWFYRVFGSLFMVFGFVALFLASIGLYGVMAFAVSRRTQEIGVRMALGAQTRDVVRMVFRQGMIQLGIGLAVGLALAALLSKLLQIILFEVNPRDPVIFAGIVVLLVLTGLAASLVPARRATRVDPIVALHYE